MTQTIEEQESEGRPITSEVYIEGFGMVREYGTLDFESFIMSLLETNYFKKKF